MESAGEPKPVPQSSPQNDPEPSRGRPKRSNQRRGPRGEDSVEERRSRPRASDRTGSNGFRDELDHASCVAMDFTPSPTGVIYGRTGVATMTAAIVARRDDAVLQCDLQHAGPHIWPDGEVVDREDSASNTA